MDRVGEISKRLEEATPGIWEERQDSDYYQGGTYVGVDPYHYVDGKKIPGRYPKVPENCYFRTDICREEEGFTDIILHCKSDIAYLLSLVKAADELARAAKAVYENDDAFVEHHDRNQVVKRDEALRDSLSAYFLDRGTGGS